MTGPISISLARPPTQDAAVVWRNQASASFKFPNPTDRNGSGDMPVQNIAIIERPKKSKDGCIKVEIYGCRRSGCTPAARVENPQQLPVAALGLEDRCMLPRLL